MRSRLLILSTLALSLAIGCGKKEEPSTTTTTQAPAAQPTVEAVTMASKVDSGNNPANSTATFAKTDTIWAVADVTDVKSGTPVEARWFHVTSNQQINSNTVTTTSDGRHRLPFFIAKPDGWPTGDYRVDIYVGGNMLRSESFQVQ